MLLQWQVNGQCSSSIRSTASSRCQSRVAPRSKSFRLTPLPKGVAKLLVLCFPLEKSSQFLSLSLPRNKPNKSNGTARRLELIMVKARICLWWSEYCGSRSQKSWAIPKLTDKIAHSKERHKRGGERKGECCKEAWEPNYHLRLRNHNRYVRITISK